MAAGGDPSALAGGLGEPETEGGLIGALAASYDEDMEALGRMQAEREARQSLRSVEFHGAAEGSEASRDTPAQASGASVAEAAPANPPANPPANSPANPPAVSADPTNSAPNANAAPVVAASRPELAQASTPVATQALRPDPASGNAAAASAAVEPDTGSPQGASEVSANGVLELPAPEPPPAPEAKPEDRSALASRLSEALAAEAAASEHPLQQWLAAAALALGSPDAPLPLDAAAGADSDLLPAERDRVLKAHAAFAAIGKALASGTSVAPSDAEALVAALTGGPELVVPKVEFCTKIEGFGRFQPLGNDRFLAGTKARFILYSELAGFASALESGAFTTRLATRVSIESERDGVVVWRRSPEWTAVVDSSPTRRGEFFVGEIVTLTEYLTVGGYRLRIEIRDESSGVVATATRPFTVVADPAMAAVGD